LQYGGDGTVNHILNCIVNTKNYLSVIPVGTGNDFYKALDQSKELYTRVDIGKINEKYFINTACFGIDADVANNSKILKNKLIPISQRYNASVIYTFFKYKNKEIEISCEKYKKSGKFTTIAICNGRYYGGGYNIAPNSKYDDGLFDVYYAYNLSKILLPSLILKMKKGKHEGSSYIKKIQTNEITIKSKEKIVCNIDGEEIENNVFNIKLIGKAVVIYNNKELINKILK